MILRPNSRSCRTASIRSGIAGGLAGELAPKRLELLHELVPTANVIALLVNPTSPDITKTVSRGLEAAARILGLQLHILNASTDGDFDTVFATLIQLRVGALMIAPDLFFITRNEQLHIDDPPRGARNHAVSRVRHVWRPDELRRQHYGRSSPGRHLYRPSTQGRKACRTAGPAVNESRADHQPQDCEGARGHCSAITAPPRRRGNRVTLASVDALCCNRSGLKLAGP